MEALRGFPLLDPALLLQALQEFTKLVVGLQGKRCRPWPAGLRPAGFCNHIPQAELMPFCAQKSAAARIPSALISTH